MDRLMRLCLVALLVACAFACSSKKGARSPHKAKGHEHHHAPPPKAHGHPAPPTPPPPDAGVADGGEIFSP